MIRSVAALFAKKTAIVAITGMTVIGGATLALAEDDTGSTTEVEDTTTTTEVEDTTTTTEVDDDLALDGEVVTDDPEIAVDEDADDAGEHPDNHGKYVSEAAKGGGPCADLEAGGYENKGQCVSEVARSDAGKPGAEAPVEEPVIEQTQTAPAEKPGKGGGGKGKKG